MKHVMFPSQDSFVTAERTRELAVHEQGRIGLQDVMKTISRNADLPALKPVQAQCFRAAWAPAMT
jgi:hypothetical protein